MAQNLQRKPGDPYDPEPGSAYPTYSNEDLRQLEQAYGAPAADRQLPGKSDPLEQAYGAPAVEPERLLGDEQRAGSPSGLSGGSTDPGSIGRNSGLGYDDTDQDSVAARTGLGGGSGGSGGGGGRFGGFARDNFGPNNFNPFGQAKSNAKKGARRFLIGGGIGAVVVSAFIFLFFIFQGYAQIVHFAQILERANFTANQLFLAHRAGQLIKYSRTVDSPINRNMGFFGNKFADHYEAKLKAAGVEPNYENRRIKSITIDTNNPDGARALDNLREKGLINGVTIGANGLVDIDIDPPGRGSAAFRRGAITAVVESLGLENVSGEMAKYSLKKRALVNFHPFKNAVRAADESLREYYDKRREERSRYTREGSVEVARQASASPDVDGNTTTEDLEAARSAQDLSDTAAGEGGKRTKTENLKAKLNTGVGVTGYMSLLCAIKGLGDESGNIRQQNIVQPLERTAMNIQSSGGQIQAGIDLNTDEVGELDELLYDEETKTSWSSARSIQAEYGHALTGPDMPDGTKPGKDKPPFFAVLDETVGAIPGGNKFCDGVNSTAGGIALTVASVALNSAGPISALLGATSAGLQYALADIFIDDVISWIAGQQVDTLPQGALLGNYAMYGSRLAANETALSYGGAELSGAESIALKNEINRAIEQEQQHSSLYARYLDVSNMDSLAATTLFQSPLTATSVSNVSSLVSLPQSFFSNVVGSLGHGLSSKAGAADTYNYGFPQYGFTLGEIDDERFENPYENASVVESQLVELNETYGKPCFGTVVDPATFAISDVTEGGKRYDEIPETCKDRSNELLMRYRFYLADMTVANCLAQYEGIDEGGCNTGATLPESDVATPAADGGDLDMDSIREDSSAVACAENTKDVGIHQGFTQGREVKIRVCAVSNITSTSEESSGGFGVSGASGKLVVNSRVSKAFYDMAEAAKADGITLRAASGFRSNQHQTQLCNANPGCSSGNYATVAKPGTSNHQLGVAVDFYIGGLGISTGSCINVNGRCTAKGHKEWEWLEANAGKFGMKQYVNEFWHWSPLEN